MVMGPEWTGMEAWGMHQNPVLWGGAHFFFPHRKLVFSSKNTLFGPTCLVIFSGFSFPAAPAHFFGGSGLKSLIFLRFFKGLSQKH